MPQPLQGPREPSAACAVSAGSCPGSLCPEADGASHQPTFQAAKLLEQHKRPYRGPRPFADLREVLGDRELAGGSTCSLRRTLP